MPFKVRKANIYDLDKLVEFTISEANEAEGIFLSMKNVQGGIKAGLEDDSIARYWVLENEKEQLVGNVSVVKEWSDWNSGYYWWIQSMFITPEHRGKGLINMLLKEVKTAAICENAIDLRLYVHKENKRAIRAYKKEGFRDSDYNIMIMTDFKT